MYPQKEAATRHPFLDMARQTVRKGFLYNPRRSRCRNRGWHYYYHHISRQSQCRVGESFVHDMHCSADKRCISMHRKKLHKSPISAAGNNILLSMSSKPHSPDLPDHRLDMFMVAVAVHLFPYIYTRGGGCGDGGAVVSITEALPLQDILRVLPLRLAWQHWSIGHAVEEREGHPVARSTAQFTANIVKGISDCADFKSKKSCSYIFFLTHIQQSGKEVSEESETTTRRTQNKWLYFNSDRAFFKYPK